MKLFIVLIGLMYLSPTSGKAPFRTPMLVLPTNASKDMIEAARLIKRYANSDEFYTYVKAKRKSFAHTDLSVGQAIAVFRLQLDGEDKIRVSYYTPLFFDEKRNYLGGWTGREIKENFLYDLRPNQRAGHLLHEISHAYGFEHKGNDVNKFDNVNSFPYAIGYDFYKFLELKK